MTERLSRAQACRIALAAQGFAAPRPATVDRGHLRRTVERLGLHQIDSVNVLARAHYLPAFSRLGSYDRALLDRAAWGRRSERRLFEYWAHEASLLPLDYHPLLRWRMDLADRGESGWSGLRLYAHEQRPRAEAILARIRTDGPLASSDFAEAKGGGGWWGWSEVKQALEWLFWAGHLTTATRRSSFERVYDLPERVLPADVLSLPTPSAAEAKRSLIAHAARALGVASESDLRDYFRLDLASAATAVRELVEDGELIPVAIDGWRSAYLHRDATRPRRIRARALLAPFDPLIWDRARAERLFGFRYRIEIYTPAPKRTHGYYVLPFLLDDRLVARVDLKADRQAQALLVQSVHREPHAPAETRRALADELQLMASWLGLADVRYRTPAQLD